MRKGPGGHRGIHVDGREPSILAQIEGSHHWVQSRHTVQLYTATQVDTISVVASCASLTETAVK